jgi:integrase
MASIVTLPNGFRRLQYTDGEGERRTIYLGKMNKRDAETFRSRVESLLSSLFAGSSPDRETSMWVSNLPGKVKIKLAKHGLITGVEIPEKIKANTTPTVQELFSQYIETMGKSKKPATILNWKQATEQFLNYLPNNIRLNEITTGTVRDWVESMRPTLAGTTLHKRFSICRQIFDYAIDHKQLRENPFTAVKVKKPKPLVNVEVSRETIERVLRHCSPKWAAIVSLSRYGGLRCPSEVLSLKWEHIDFDAGVMTIPEPKVEHHEGRGLRKCPLFPEVRKALESLPGREGFVVGEEMYSTAFQKNGWRNANLRTAMLDILARAEVKPWPRLFHSMRASRQTEIEIEFGLPAACAWLGNTESIAKESYLLVFEEAWQRAAGKTSTPRHTEKHTKKHTAPRRKRSEEAGSKDSRPKKKP